MLYDDTRPQGSPLGLYDRSIPTGSPLSPMRWPQTYAAAQDEEPPTLQAPQAMLQAPPPQLAAPEAPRELPAPPPSKSRGPSIWDKEHISETLANIGAGFFSTQDFGSGLGAAAQAIAGGNRQLRAEQMKSTTYGGPNNTFAITTDARGNRTVREVPEFAAAHKADVDAKHQTPPQVKADLRARFIKGVMDLPPGQRAAAYAEGIQNGAAYGIDPEGMPAAWSENYGTLGAHMGLTVDQDLRNERANVVAQDQIRHRGVQETMSGQRVQQGAARVAQGAQRVQLSAQSGARAAAKANAPKAPPGLRGATQVKNRDQYNSLPKGARYVAPDGTVRTKS